MNAAHATQQPLTIVVLFFLVVQLVISAVNLLLTSRTPAANVQQKKWGTCGHRHASQFKKHFPYIEIVLSNKPLLGVMPTAQKNECNFWLMILCTTQIPKLRQTCPILASVLS